MLMPVIGAVIVIALIVGGISAAVGGCQSDAEKTQQQAREQAAEVRQEAKEKRQAVARSEQSAEERLKGFHCLSAWDGNHNGFERLVKPLLGVSPS